MKYILLPIIKIIIVLFHLLVSYPIVFLYLMLIALWNFKFKTALATFKSIRFDEQQIEGKTDVPKYWIYKTPWDYLLNKKTWIENKKEEES